MLPSPSFNIPSIGTPHHALEEVKVEHVIEYFLETGYDLHFRIK